MPKGGHRRESQDLRTAKRHEARGLQARVRCVSSDLCAHAAGLTRACAAESQTRTASYAFACGSAVHGAAILGRGSHLLPYRALMGDCGICCVPDGAEDGKVAHPAHSLRGENTMSHCASGASSPSKTRENVEPSAALKGYRNCTTRARLPRRNPAREREPRRRSNSWCEPGCG
jgi:hypothetical protein